MRQQTSNQFLLSFIQIIIYNLNVFLLNVLKWTETQDVYQMFRIHV